MSTVTLSERVTATDLKPLDFAAKEDAPQFVGAWAHAFANAWVNNACGPGVIHKHTGTADAGTLNSEDANIEDLVGIRSRSVTS
jgi:hypothetical protein